jgi:hypothetical protein
MDPRTLCLTASSEIIYAVGWLDLRHGTARSSSSSRQACSDSYDSWFHYVTDLGAAGPDRGKGGKFLFLPPDYQGEAPDGYFVCRTPTFGNLLGSRPSSSRLESSGSGRAWRWFVR